MFQHGVTTYGFLGPGSYGLWGIAGCMGFWSKSPPTDLVDQKFYGLLWVMGSHRYGLLQCQLYRPIFKTILLTWAASHSSSKFWGSIFSGIYMYVCPFYFHPVYSLIPSYPDASFQWPSSDRYICCWFQCSPLSFRWVVWFSRMDWYVFESLTLGYLLMAFDRWRQQPTYLFLHPRRHAHGPSLLSAQPPLYRRAGGPATPTYVLRWWTWWSFDHPGLCRRHQPAATSFNPGHPTS